jgi:hypothetical protein
MFPIVAASARRVLATGLLNLLCQNRFSGIDPGALVGCEEAFGYIPTFQGYI